jgi:hypothetical protein
MRVVDRWVKKMPGEKDSEGRRKEEREGGEEGEGKREEK